MLSSKFCEEERKTRKHPTNGSRHRSLHVTVAVTRSLLLVLHSFQQNFEERRNCSQSSKLFDAFLPVLHTKTNKSADENGTFGKQFQKWSD